MYCMPVRACTRSVIKLDDLKLLQLPKLPNMGYHDLLSLIQTGPDLMALVVTK